MRVVAVIGIRNEIAYLANLLQYLIDNGVDYAIIDNDSSDGSGELANSLRFKGNLVAYERLPYEGFYDWEAILKAKERLYRKVDADWLIHHDADEIMHSYQPRETISETLSRISTSGANVVNFDEFVFVPIDHSYQPESGGQQPLTYYYFFEPMPLRLMRAWHATLSVSNVDTGGHKLSGHDIVIAEESMALRHYMFKNQQHAYTKYNTRTYSKKELARGWHGNRVGFSELNYTFPQASLLQSLVDPSDRNLNRQSPKRHHYWDWNRQPSPVWKRAASALLRRFRLK
jgi:hypothetical protein